MNEKIEYWQENGKNLPLEKSDENFNICWICGRNFIMKRSVSKHCTDIHKIDIQKYYDKFYKIENEGKCKQCGKLTTFFFGRYLDYCSYNCSNNSLIINQQRGKTIKEVWKTVDRNARWQKTQQTNLKKYGTEIIYNLPNIKEKRDKSILDKYGTLNFQKTDLYQTIRKNSIFKKYGVENISQIDEVKDKKRKISRIQTYQNFERFKNQIIPLFSIEEYKGNNKRDYYQWKCIKCNTIFEDYYDDGVLPRCPTCFPITRSKFEDLFEIFFKIHNIKYVHDDRQIIKPNELDFYLPEKHIAIECDGIYWHSEGNGKTKNYHLQKTKLCETKQIKLIHIFEDEWMQHPKIVFSRLKNILHLIKYRIFARKCEIRVIDVELKNKFLNKYHIQGEDKSCVYLGAFYKNRLVSVMTFCKLRKALGQTHKEGSWELSRFCTMNNFNIIGIASKMLNFFEKNYNPIQMVSYADRRWSQGNVYNQLGFKLDHISPPNYWYMKNHFKRMHRFNFRKNVLKDKLENFDPNLSEWENMKANGYDRIWDCGNLVFIKNYPIKNLTCITSLKPVPLNN
jgi:hypothetical protein